ncbi:Transcriptional regulator SlyA [Phycisphaerae bacterium RAS1]|nr:Transcriptional regulator SlyA [Phycisphaerae bacterium RAS1]
MGLTDMKALRPAADPSITPPPPGGGSAGDRATRLMRACHIFSAAVRETLESALLREVCPRPLTLAQFHLLKLLVLNGQHQAGELADFLGVSAPAATKNIDKLVRLGLLLRRPSADDRRALSLSVSARGREIVRRCDALKAARMQKIVRQFADDDLLRLTGLLERFSTALYEATRVESDVCLRCGAYLESECAVRRVHGGCPYQRQRRRGGTAHAPHT